VQEYSKRHSEEEKDSTKGRTDTEETEGSRVGIDAATKAKKSEKASRLGLILLAERANSPELERSAGVEEPKAGGEGESTAGPQQVLQNCGETVGGTSKEERCFAFLSEQKVLEGIASSKVGKVTNKVVTCAVDAAVSDSAASTVLASRKADAALEFHALLGFAPKSRGGGEGGDVSSRVGAKGDGGESARINERAGGEAVREDRKPIPKHIKSLPMSLDSLAMIAVSLYAATLSRIHFFPSSSLVYSLPHFRAHFFLFSFVCYLFFFACSRLQCLSSTLFPSHPLIIDTVVVLSCSASEL